MRGVKRFEELEVWQKAREMAREIYACGGEGGFVRDFGLRDQIRRAAVSVVSNIAEGFERGGDREFRQFLAQAKGSCGEVRAQLYIALDQGFLAQEQFDRLCERALQVSRMIAGLMSYLRASELKGTNSNEVESKVPGPRSKVSVPKTLVSAPYLPLDLVPVTLDYPSDLGPWTRDFGPPLIVDIRPSVKVC
jgi:four helix bundle protein